MTRLRRRVVLAVGLAVAGALLVIPAIGQANQEVVRLHLGSDGQYFRYLTTTQNLTTARNGCQIVSPETLIDLSSSNGGTSQPGLASLAIGVKSSGSNSNGSPCGQVDSVEKLFLQPTGSLAGRLFKKVVLDLEMTGNAVVRMTLSRGTTSQVYQLQTGTSISPAQTGEPGYDTTAPYAVSSGPGDEVDACAAPNSSGPNSNINDNCQWTVDPGFEFDRIEITTTVGTVSLEGSGDFGNDPAYDSLFYLVTNNPPDAVNDTADVDENTPDTSPFVDIDVLDNDTDLDNDVLTVTSVTQGDHGTVTINADNTVRYTPAEGYVGQDTFDYTISDGRGGTDTATVTVDVVETLCTQETVPFTSPSGVVNGTITKVSGTGEVVCKRYTLVASDASSPEEPASLLFVPSSASGTKVNYRAFLSLGEQDPSNPLSGQIEYDPDAAGPADWKLVPWCDDAAFDSAGIVTDATVPDGDTWCIASETTATSGSATDPKTTTTWQLWGEDDPKFR